jgi:hypothetical protein
MTLALTNVESTLLREIADKSLHRKDIAQTYHLALKSGERINWVTVNHKIIERWSKSGLEWIKKQAWSGKCFDVKPALAESEG